MTTKEFMVGFYGWKAACEYLEDCIIHLYNGEISLDDFKHILADYLGINEEE